MTEIIVLREIPREQAEKEILEFIGKNPGASFYDISNELRLDLEFVVNVCLGLISKGKLTAGEPLKSG